MQPPVVLIFLGCTCSLGLSVKLTSPESAPYLSHNATSFPDDCPLNRELKHLLTLMFRVRSGRVHQREVGGADRSG